MMTKTHMMIMVICAYIFSSLYRQPAVRELRAAVHLSPCRHSADPFQRTDPHLFLTIPVPLRTDTVWNRFIAIRNRFVTIWNRFIAASWLVWTDAIRFQSVAIRNRFCAVRKWEQWRWGCLWRTTSTLC
jgi:hypothetical protein